MCPWALCDIYLGGKNEVMKRDNQVTILHYQPLQWAVLFGIGIDWPMWIYNVLKSVAFISKHVITVRMNKVGNGGQWEERAPTDEQVAMWEQWWLHGHRFTGKAKRQVPLFETDIRNKRAKEAKKAKKAKEAKEEESKKNNDNNNNSNRNPLANKEENPEKKQNELTKRQFTLKRAVTERVLKKGLKKKKKSSQDADDHDVDSNNNNNNNNEIKGKHNRKGSLLYMNQGTIFSAQRDHLQKQKALIEQEREELTREIAKMTKQRQAKLCSQWSHVTKAHGVTRTSVFCTFFTQ